MMCARRLNGQDFCQGDSRGPLLIKGSNGAADLSVRVVLGASAFGCATNAPKPTNGLKVKDAGE
jgi:secreted trypsin-like serine protease